MSAATNGWRFEWRRSWQEIWSEEFLREWRRVLAHAERPHVYHRPEVIRAWVDSCGATLDVEPYVGIATSTSGAEVLLAWIIVKHHGRVLTRRTLEPAGRELFGYHTPLLAGGDPSAIDWHQFWTAARASVGRACDQALFRFVEPEFASGSRFKKPSEASPVLSLDGCADVNAVLARCASGHRVDVKRQMRRASEHGELTLWTARADESAAALESFRTQMWPAYRLNWRSGPTKSALLDDGVVDFLERVIVDGVSGGWGHYSVLKIGGTAVAWHLGLVDAGRLYYWVPTHDAQWSSYSPGKLLLAELIASGCRRGWKEIEFLTGNHSYKHAWNPTQRALTAVAWTAPTLRGRAIGWYDARQVASHRAAS
jgi:CelD/BcsL family acetyltransferase involved in cellulose biosynthesis